MIEMLGVLAVIGVLSAGGIMGYSTAMENYRTNKFISDINTISASAMNVFNKSILRKERYDIGSQNLCQLKIIPLEYCKNTKTNYIKSMFGGEMLLFIVTYMGESNTDSGQGLAGIDNTMPNANLQLRIFGQMPFGVCTRILSHNWSTSMVSVSVVNMEYNSGGYRTLPISDKNLIKNICETSASGDMVFRFFFYGKKR